MCTSFSNQLRLLEWNGLDARGKVCNMNRICHLLKLLVLSRPHLLCIICRPKKKVVHNMIRNLRHSNQTILQMLIWVVLREVPWKIELMSNLILTNNM